MADIFAKSDTDGSGALSLAEFQKCCRDADIGLTRKEKQLAKQAALAHAVDEAGEAQAAPAPTTAAAAAGGGTLNTLDKFLKPLVVS